MAFTQADIDALDRAIASNELEVEIDGERVKFGNFTEARARRRFILEQLQQQAGNPGRVRQMRINVCKGV